MMPARRPQILTDGEQIIGIATPGREVVAPEQTTVYTLVAFCGGTIVQADQTVTVECCSSAL